MAFLPSLFFVTLAIANSIRIKGLPHKRKRLVKLADTSWIRYVKTKQTRLNCTIREQTRLKKIKNEKNEKNVERKFVGQTNSVLSL